MIYYNVITTFKVSGKKCCSSNQLSDVDVFLGASAISSDSFLCTTDKNDFPKPFFSILDQEPLTKGEYIYMLKANKSFFDIEWKKLIESLKAPSPTILS